MLVFLSFVTVVTCCNFDFYCADSAADLSTINENDAATNCTQGDDVEIDCTVEELPLFSLVEIPRIHVSIPNCSVTNIQWQAVFSTHETVVNLTRCPLECTCDSMWMSAHSRGINLILPESFQCPSSSCPQGRLKVEQEQFDVEPGDSFVVDVEVDGDIDLNLLDRNRQYFKWALRERHDHREEISSRRLRLFVDNVTSTDLGLVHVICWHCVHPLFTSVQVRIQAPLHVSFDQIDSAASHLFVYGYPLDRLLLTVTDEAQNSIIHRLPPPGNSSSAKFWDSLVIRPDLAHSMFYRRVFTVFTVPCYHCAVDHIFGNFSFRICEEEPYSTNSTELIEDILSSAEAEEKETQCQEVYHLINYHNQTLMPEMPSIPTGSRKGAAVAFVLAILAICAFLGIAVRMPGVRRRMDHVSRIYESHRRKWTFGSRRASRATDQTMLREEEERESISLSSGEYCGHIIPSIKGGSVEIHEKIGSGAFGEVYCASWERTGSRSVAVKTIRQADEDVEKEALVLSKLDHENIVRLHGMLRQGERLLIVMEMMRLGNLQKYLERRKPQGNNYAQFPPALAVSELKFIIREITKGLRYLGAQQIVHRDLAARNCLVDGNSDLTCVSAKSRPPIRVKISDFGMSRRLAYETDYYRMQTQSLLPVRWLPPEAINEHRFSHQSDIWALGVTMWEVFSYGCLPFESLSNHEVVSYAMAGMRPPPPRGCPPEMYELMEKCWAWEPEDRISPEEALLDPVLADEFPPIHRQLMESVQSDQAAVQYSIDDDSDVLHPSCEPLMA